MVSQTSSKRSSFRHSNISRIIKRRSESIDTRREDFTQCVRVTDFRMQPLVGVRGSYLLKLFKFVGVGYVDLDNARVECTLIDPDRSSSRDNDRLLGVSLIVRWTDTVKNETMSNVGPNVVQLSCIETQESGMCGEYRHAIETRESGPHGKYCHAIETQESGPCGEYYHSIEIFDYDVVKFINSLSTK